MSFTQFAKAICYIGPKQLTMETQCSITRTTGSQPVKTVALGYAGESPGSPMGEISIDSAVPSADFELDPGQFMKNLKQATITIFGPNRTLTTDLFIYEDTFTHSVDQESKLSFKGRCQYPDWI